MPATGIPPKSWRRHDAVAWPWPRATLFLVFALGIWVSASGLVDSIVTYREDIVYLTKQHLVLVVSSGTAAILVGLPVGIWLSRPSMERYAETVMQVFNIGTTIPTLAVVALSMTLLGIGFPPAFFGLFVASLLPIVRNTYAGLLTVPSHLKEAATGMGMTRRQILWRIELPNALYVIFSGIRTALAINVGTTPLAFLIGGGGLGELIFTGIDLMDTGMLLAGAIPTAALAVAVDFLMGQAQLHLIPKGVNPLR
ncbi:ABC transporter permease [Paracoccus methylarcula]|uniref:ABC transporter permease n=1 Tax=Paracoccus methylarcula TaxID=72022 RepID=A0A3R7NYB9_9RHOB|nr:ABC transporter permease [Paracoccus methylarcula]RNF35254.1 ABC transporter permease [Paracoccus methylarcula]